MIVQVLYLIIVLHITDGLKCEWGTNNFCKQGTGSTGFLNKETVTENKGTFLMDITAWSRGGICSMYCIQHDVDVCSKALTWESCDGDQKCTKHTFDNKTFVDDTVPGTFFTSSVRVLKAGPVDLSDNNITCTVSYYSGISLRRTHHKADTLYKADKHFTQIL